MSKNKKEYVDLFGTLLSSFAEVLNSIVDNEEDTCNECECKCAGDCKTCNNENCKTRENDEICEEYSTLNNDEKQYVIDTANNVIKSTMNALGITDYEKYLVTDEDLNKGVLVKKIELPEKDTCDTCCQKDADKDWYEAKVPMPKDPSLIKSDGLSPEVKDPTMCKGPVLDAAGEEWFPANPYLDTGSNVSSQKIYDIKDLAPEIISPSDTIKVGTNADGKEVVAANPYYKEGYDAEQIKAAKKEKFFNKHLNTAKVISELPDYFNNEAKELMDEYNKHRNNIVDDITKPLNPENAKENISLKDKLVAEYTTIHPNEQIDTEATIKELIGCVVRQLNDSETHDYRILPGDSNTPPAVQVRITDVNSVIKKRLDILQDIEEKLKSEYGFNNVYTTVHEKLHDKTLVDLVYFLTLD